MAPCGALVFASSLWFSCLSASGGGHCEGRRGRGPGLGWS